MNSELKYMVHVTEKGMRVQFDGEQGYIEIVAPEHVTKPHAASIYLGAQLRVITHATLTLEELNHSEIDQVLVIQPTWDIEAQYVQRYVEQCIAKSTTQQLKDVELIPSHAVYAVEKYVNVLQGVLDSLGYVYTPRLSQGAKEGKTKAKPAKTQHRFTKEISTKAFFVDTPNCKATVYWQKRNEMLIKKGASLLQEIPLNKDGSLGISAKMGEKLRSDNQVAIQNFTTIADIVLKSVNEVGLLLYYGGKNGWLELRDENGVTIDELTRID